MEGIPAIIHCCWFGGRKTRLAKRCLESWRRFAPDLAVREWDEQSVRAEFAGEDAAFFETALAAKAWAAASDWARMAALWRFGGVYFDFDLELVSPLRGLPKAGWIASEWMRDGSARCNPGGGIALPLRSPVARGMLDFYAGKRYSRDLDMMWIISRELAPLLAANPSVATLSPDVFSPIAFDGSCRRSSSTVGIHRYAMSGAGPARRFARWLSWHGMGGIVEALLGSRGRKKASVPFDTVHVCAGIDVFNGAAAVAASIAREQAAQGRRVAFVSVAPPRGVPEVGLSGVERIVFRRTSIPVLRRLCFSAGMLFGLRRICRNAGTVHVHCDWTFPVWAASFFARKRLVFSPHGSFDPVRLRHSRVKKFLAGFIERACLRKAAAVHATTRREEEWIRAFEPRTGKIAVEPPGTDIPPQSMPRIRRAGEPLRVLYLGRRHPLKGVGMLEKAVEGLDVELRTEDSLSGREKEEAFEWCDVFCLPTKSENFGLAVAEALAHSRPAITTRGAPAWEELPARACGWFTDVSAEALRAALEEAASLPPGRLAAMGAAGREWMEKDFSARDRARAISKALEPGVQA